MSIVIRQATTDDCHAIALLHKSELPTSFLGTLSLAFLRLLYRSQSTWRQGIVLVAADNNKVIGFISGVQSSVEFFRYFCCTQWLAALGCVLPNLVSPVVFKKITQTLAYRKRAPIQELPQAELLSIAVLRTYRQRGVGKQLFLRLTDYMRSCGVSEFHIIVGKQLKTAQEFYQHLGCEYRETISIHTNEDSEVYVFKCV